MVVKRKAILKKAVSRNLQEKKFENAKRRLADAFRGIPKRPGGGMVQLDPREWNGGFGEDDLFRGQPGANPNVPPGGFGPGKGRIYLDPREWNGGFDGLRQAVMPPDYQPGGNDKQQHIENLYQQQQALSQNPGMRERIQGLNNGMRDGFNNSMNQGKEQFERSLQGFRGQPPTSGGGGVGSGNPPVSPYPQKQTPMPFGGRPVGSGGGMIHLDPREWNGGFGDDSLYRGQPGANPNVPSGGFGPGKGFNRPPMKMPMMPGGSGIGGGQRPIPMPGLGGGMPLQPPQGPKQMPMPNPRRNLIPRPIDPRYKMM